MDSRQPLTKEDISLDSAFLERARKINESSGSFKRLEDLTDEEREYFIEFSLEEQHLLEEFSRLERANLYNEWKQYALGTKNPRSLISFLEDKLKIRKLERIS